MPSKPGKRKEDAPSLTSVRAARLHQQPYRTPRFWKYVGIMRAYRAANSVRVPEFGLSRLELERVVTHFEHHPREECPSITAHYDELVGLSIARGFTHRVRELFGGPRGCTHTTALLQAMAPIGMQCFWSMKAAAAKVAGLPDPLLDPRRNQDETWRLTIDT